MPKLRTSDGRRVAVLRLLKGWSSESSMIEPWSPERIWEYRGLTIRFVGGEEVLYHTWENLFSGDRHHWQRDMYRLQTLGAGAL